MAFVANLELTDGVARISLAGELDASVTPRFRTLVEEAEQHRARRIVLMMNELSYMSSAGIRELVFLKQKMGPHVDVYLVGTQELVLEAITMTGVQHSVILLDQYIPEQIEQREAA